MATPAYWATGYKKLTIAAFTDVADWIIGIRTMLTSTLDVADRWVESPANTFTSPADAITGNKVVMALTRTSATALDAAFSQIVGGVTTAFVANGFRAQITGSVTATIFAGPKHFWTQSSGTEMLAIAMGDPSPEAPSGFSAQALVRSFRNNGGAGYSTNDDVWQGIPDSGNGTVGCPRAMSPFFLEGGTQDQATAGGSYFYTPVAAVFWSTTLISRFIGNLYQFVWVDGTFAAGNFVSVPIDVGVVGVFQVLAGMSRANGGIGARLAVRIG